MQIVHPGPGTCQSSCISLHLVCWFQFHTLQFGCRCCGFCTLLSQVLLQAFEPSTILLLQILTGLGKGKDIKMSLETKEPGSACQTRTFLAASISSCVNLVEFLYPYISSIPFMGNRSRCNCATSTCSWLSSPFKQVMILYHAGP